MKKILIALLVAVSVFQFSIFPVFAGNMEEIENEEWTGSEELIVISDEDVEIQGGKYSYKLVIRENGTLSFDNDLEICYQGIEGGYQLNYEIEEDGNHIMTVTGYFENIISDSPLLEQLPDENKEWILSHISGDSYYYQLNLRTGEGFTFTNILRFFLDSEPHGYSAVYVYDLLTDEQTLDIYSLTDADRIDPSKADALTEEQALEAIKNYCYMLDPNLKDMEDSEEYTIYWEVFTNEDQEIVVLFRSYTGARIRYYVDPASGDTYVTEFVPGITDEEERTEENFNIRDYSD